MRVWLGLLLVAAYGCTDECESLPPQFQLDIRSGTGLGSLEVIVGFDGERRREVFPVNTALDDGETSLVVELRNNIQADFQLEVTVNGYSGIDANGQVVGSGSDRFEGSPDGCNRFELELDPETPPPDAGFPDGGNPGICDPICLDADCNLDCTGDCSPCQMSCTGATASCNTSCGSETCEIYCVGVGACDSDCGNGSNCVISCEDSPVCRAKCTGNASCLLKCESSGDCAYSVCSGTMEPCADGSIACNHACP